MKVSFLSNPGVIHDAPATFTGLASSIHRAAVLDNPALHTNLRLYIHKMQSELGKTLIIMGIVLAVVGVILYSRTQIPWLGKLPGDIRLKGENYQIYFPIVTSIVLSILLTIIINFFRK